MRMESLRSGVRASNILLESYPPLRKPCELHGGGGNSLQPGKIDGSFPALARKIAVDLEVPANTFDNLEVDVVQGGAAGNEVFCNLLVTYSKLNPFVAAEVKGDPALPSLSFASNPVSEHLALVRISLTLDHLPIHKFATLAGCDRWICIDTFNTYVQLGDSRNV